MFVGGAVRGRRALGLAVVGLTSVVVACSGGSGTEVRGSGDEAPVDVSAAGKAAIPLLDLAVDLERQLAAASPGADVAVAPLPVATSLSQARSGAGGSTAEELDRVLHTPAGADGADQLAEGLSSAERIVSSRNGEQRDELTTRKGTVSIDLASSLWFQKGTTFDPSWLDSLAGTWGAGVRTTAFRSDTETARKAVNSWIADATKDHIDQLAPRGSISPTTRILAGGAAYLKAPWVTPFADTETRLAPFHHLDGSVSTASMMRNRGLYDVRTGTGDGWVAVDLPYLGRSLWMTLIIPDEGRFAEVEQALDGRRIDTMVDGLRAATVDLTLPKFGFTTDLPLTDALRTLGLSGAMDPVDADFGGVSREPLWLTAVLHQTYLAVAEQGTEATATNPVLPTTSTTATPGTSGAGGATSAAPTATTPGPAASSPVSTATAGGTITVAADRPFLVLVRDRTTGVPLFYGRVLSPNG